MEGLSMRRSVRWVFAVVLAPLLTAASLALAGPAAAAPTSSPPAGVTELGPAGGESRVIRVNARGDVVGSATPVPDGVWSGQLWRGGNSTSLELGTHAQAVNNNGDVVGCTADGVGLLWRHGTLTRVQRAGQSICFLGINDSGQVIGTAATRPNGATKAFVWQDGTFTDLSTPANRASYPIGINNRGQVVGRLFGATTSLPIRTVVWSGGRRTDIGTLGGEQTTPTAINQAGVVIGTSKLANGHTHPFVWQHGRMTDLLAGTGIVDDQSYVSAVNGAGEVVGTVSGRPALWRHGSLTYLAPATVKGEAVAINASGTVTGVVRSAAGDPSVFRWRGGRLTRLPSLAGSDYGYPVGIDDRGRVVGNVSVEPAATSHAVIWS
jgi:probable HAF family extracellular repeat protein